MRAFRPSRLQGQGKVSVTTMIELSAQTIVAKPKVPTVAPLAIRMHRYIIWTQIKGNVLVPKALTLPTEKSKKLLHNLQNGFVHAVHPWRRMRNVIMSKTAWFRWKTLVNGEDKKRRPFLGRSIAPETIVIRRHKAPMDGGENAHLKNTPSSQFSYHQTSRRASFP